MEEIEIKTKDVDGVLGLAISDIFVGRQNTSDYPYVPMSIIYRPQSVLKNIVKQELFSLNVFSIRYPR
jgi:hypothetical protein